MTKSSAKCVGLYDNPAIMRRGARSTYSFDDFASDLERIIESHTGDVDTIPRMAQSLLERCIADPSWIGFAERNLPAAGRARRVLKHHSRRLFTASIMAFEPGRSTPIHDHATWGLVGVWWGNEREERFEHPPAEGETLPFKLRESLRNVPGTVTLLIPPTYDTHRILNESEGTAYSIHIYGAPIAGLTACTYDPTTGTMKHWEDDPIGTTRLWGGRVDLATLIGFPETAPSDLVNMLRKRIHDVAASEPFHGRERAPRANLETHLLDG